MSKALSKIRWRARERSKAIHIQCQRPSMDRPRGYTTPCYHLIQVLHLGHMLTLEPAPRTDKDQRMQLEKKKIFFTSVPNNILLWNHWFLFIISWTSTEKLRSYILNFSFFHIFCKQPLYLPFIFQHGEPVSLFQKGKLCYSTASNQSDQNKFTDTL